ncbi:MAG: hypothetical protein V4722_27890 [Bacteroidota bacterium]
MPFFTVTPTILAVTVMKASIVKKYIRIRTFLIVVPVLICLLCYALFKFLLPDYFLSENDLMVDTGTIKAAYYTTYRVYGKQRRIHDKRCVQIELVGKRYFIRLTDDLIDKFWPAIVSPENINKKIEVKYQRRLLESGRLYNPEQISIDNTIIFPFTAKRKYIGWFCIAVIVVIFIFSFLLYRIFNIYKLNLYEHDKKVGKLSKWKLFLTWLAD